MKSGIDFLDDLQKRKSRYTNPEQPETLYQALLQLSSGIYAEEERFVYELLQNADDAKEDEAPLVINIILKDGYFVFAHNGRPFNERDIEGICDIGNGGKKLDKGKIGYKGIGFKSVFHHSNCVTILCPEYQFRFDEAHWDGFWDTAWDESYRSEDSTKYHLPWQLIPIHTPTAPIDIPEGCQDNVRIFIKARDIETLSEKVSHLVSDPNLLLFLKNKNISISFQDIQKSTIIVTKEEKNGHIVLTLNGHTVGKWLLLNPDPIHIPEPVQERIALDFNTPNKMKMAKEVEISFALSVNDDRIARLDDALVYTYLPTSEKLGFPFIINSNFILDSGRQHLKRDSVWNKYLLSLIPRTLFSALKANDAAIVHKYSNSWFSILPEKSIDGALFVEYNKEMLSVIENEPIVPNLDGKFLTVSKVIIDETGLADSIDKDSISCYLGKRDSVELDLDSLASMEYLSAFREYGIHVFCYSDLNAFFDKDYYTVPIDTEGNLSFIHGMHAFAKQLSKEQKSSFNEIMRCVPFVRNSSGTLSRPCDLYIDSGDSSLSQGIQLICPSIYHATSSSEDTWLRALGLGKVGDDTFIVNHILKSPSYITEQNAITVGRLLFKAYYRGVLVKYKNELKVLPFLTTRNTLAKLESLYIGSAYAPDFDFQANCERDCFLSEKYIEGDNQDRWKVFFKDIGCASFVGIESIDINEDEYSHIDPETTNRIHTKVKENTYVSPVSGWTGDYKYSSYKVAYIPLWMATSRNYALLTQVFEIVFKNPIQNFHEVIDSWTGYYSRPLPLACYLNDKSFLEHAFSHWQLFPCTDGKLHRMHEIFAHKKEILKLGGKYLPIFPFENVDLSWDSVLHFKNVLNLNDYLSILESVSKDSDSDNRERITEIYSILAEWLYDERIQVDVLSEWGKKNRILSTDNHYYYPEVLSVIMINGFDDSVIKAYLGQKADAKIVSLMEAFGVQIITASNCSLQLKPEDPDIDFAIKNLLLSKVSAITILSDDGSSYDTRRTSIISILEKTCFKQCTDIELTYGSHGTMIKKSFYYLDQTFYYVGPFRVSLLNDLMTPLCELLSLKGMERELLMILIEDSAGIKTYLEDLGRDVSSLEQVEATQNWENKTFETHIKDYYGEDEHNRITGFKGEIIVYEYLKSLGYEPTCKSITTSDHFDRLILFNGKNYRCIRNYDRYDISFSKNGNPVYLEVKSTTRSVGELENMPISAREFSMIDEGGMYYIARVFNVDSTSPDIYFLKGEKNL